MAKKTAAKKKTQLELPVHSSRKIGLSLEAVTKVVTDALLKANPGWQVTVTDVSGLRIVPEYGRNRARIVGDLTIILKC